MEIVTGIHQVDRVNGNSYILVRDGLTVIDTGLPAGSGKMILFSIRNTRFREPAEIKTMVITHFHMDYIGGCGDPETSRSRCKRWNWGC